MSMSMRKKRAIGSLVTYLMVIAAYLVCQYLLATGGMTRSLRGQLVPICVWVVMAVSLNLVVGVSGELSLGHAGFMSVGAFSGIVASGWMLGAFQLENEVVRLLLSMIVGGVFAGIAGVLIGIPVLRLRGDYLAIVTLAFGEIIRNVINCLYISRRGAAALCLQRQQHPRRAPRQRPQGRRGHRHHRHLRDGLRADPLYPLRGAEPRQQPLRPRHHGHP